MRKVIQGLIYNTDTAAEVCRVPCSLARTDFGWHRTTLYRTPRGRFFVAGEGGPLSRWGEKVAGNNWVAGSGLQAIGQAEACELMEAAECDPEAFGAAGLEVSDA